MRPRRLRAVEALGCLLVLGVAGAAIASQTAAHWLAWNFTASEPRGLYALETNPPEVRRGDLVVFCPPAAVIEEAPAGALRPGACPQGVAPHLKRLVAIAGDAVVVDGDGVRVNGRRIEGSRPLVRPGLRGVEGKFRGWRRVLKPGEILCLGEHPRSYDGRYYGPIRVPLLGRARGLWTWTSTSSPGR